MQKSISGLLCILTLSACSNFQIYSDKHFQRVCKTNDDGTSDCKLEPLPEQVCRDFKGNPYPEFCVLPGVPFYVKKAAYFHYTDYDLVYLQADIVIKVDNIDGKKIKPDIVITKSIPLSLIGFNPSQFKTIFNDKQQIQLRYRVDATEQELRENIQHDIHDDLENYIANKIAICTQNNTQQLCQIPLDDLNNITNNYPFVNFVSGNRVESVQIVDYSNKFYYNVNVPVFSSSIAAVKINADGTLSEVSSTVDTTNQSSAIPTSDLISNLIGLADGVAKNTTNVSETAVEIISGAENKKDQSQPPVDAKVKNMTVTLQFSSKLSPKGYRYSFKEELDSSYEISSNRTNMLNPITFNKGLQGIFTRTELPIANEKQPTKDNNDNAYKFELNGAFSPPKHE